MTPQQFLNILRNPHGHSNTDKRIARLAICDAYEAQRKALEIPVIVECQACLYIGRHDGNPGYFCTRCGGENFNFKG